jgi:predicted nucleotidyltransferase
VLDLLRGREPGLRRRGVHHLRLFGSVARGEAGPASDVDLLAEVDHDRVKFSLVDLVRMEQELGELLGRSVQVATAPEAMRAYIRVDVERDAIEVF